MADKRISDLINSEPRESLCTLDEIISKLSSVKTQYSNDSIEMLLCLANEIKQIKEDNIFNI